jgi:hypothetical protein
MNQKIELIRQLAYYIWEREGRPPDRELQHWLEAESAVGEEKAPTGSKRKSAKRSTGKNTAKRATAGKKAAKKSTAKSGTKKKTAKKTTTRGRKKS